METTQERILDAPQRERGWHETVAIVLLLAGGLFWGAGWVVGVILLWLSSVWSTRDKLIGTFVVPGGLSLSVAFLFIVSFGIGHETTSCVGVMGGPQSCQTHGGLPLAVQILICSFAA